MRSFFKLYIVLSCVALTRLYSQNNPPNISIAGDQTYCENTDIQVVTSVSITDPDPGDNTLNEVSIQISEGYQEGLDLLTYTSANPNISSTWNASEGKLVLTGPAPFTEFETAILNVLFSTTQTNFDTDRSISVNLGNANFLPSTGHYYFYVQDIGITWQDSKIAAENQTYFGLQGYLATITSQEEAQLAGEQISGAGWIGGSDQQEEGTWIWETGPEQGDVFWIGLANGNAPNGAFAFWNNNEPNQAGDEDYAHITDPSIGISGSWNDLSNTGAASGPYQPKGYVVEFGGLPGEPDINLSASTNLFMPQTSTNDVQVCQGLEIIIPVSTNADNVNWFATETSTTILNSGLSYTTSFDTSTSLWIEPVYSACATAQNRIPILVDVTQAPINNNITITECSNSDSIVVADFELDTFLEVIIEGDPINDEEDLSVLYFEDSDLSIPISGSVYTNTENFQIIYAQIQNSQTTCSSVAEITLEVIYNDLGLSSLSKCDESGNDGFAEFDLSEADELVLPGNSNDLSVSYYETLDEALSQTNALPNLYQNTVPDVQTLYTRVSAIDGCVGLGLLDLNVNTIPIPDEIDDVYYCLDTFPEPITLQSGIDEDNPEEFSYLWSNGETTNSIQVNEVGEYSVEITDTRGCNTTNSISVLGSETPEISNIDITDFSRNNSIRIIASNTTGTSIEYSLDGIDYQTSNTFTNLAEYEYLVHARDANGCGEVVQRVFLLDYPDFFTPNGDGFNDFWQIINSKEEIFLKLYIYDRYGKLIADILPTGIGWDGNYLGKPMPSNDYWFSVFREDGREYRGNFTLKR